MKNPYFDHAIQTLQQRYQLDMIHDVLLGKSNRIICYADITDTKNVFLSVISGSFTILGLDDLPGIRLDELIGYYDPNNKYAEVSGVESHLAYIQNRVYQFFRETQVTFPININQKRCWITLDLMPIDKAPQLNVFFITDVTEGMNQEELNYEKSHKDSLTGLFNKYTLDYHYGRRYMWPNFHVLYLDIDNFKPVNDTFGHNVGNDYLQAFGTILKNYQTGYNLFYRIGGDEFVGLFWETDDKVKEIAQAIIEDTSKITFPVNEKGITVSIGIMKATKRHDVIRKADRVLYDAKNKGKNQYIYEIEI